MIEMIQDNGKQKDTQDEKLPRNIRQIGRPEKDFRIYMEDYVYTYLHPADVEELATEQRPRLLILLGSIEKYPTKTCAFISGAISVEKHAFEEGIPELDKDTWEAIQKEIQTYFQGEQIVGWVLDFWGCTLEITEDIERIHRLNFGEADQFLFYMDSKEREEAFYTMKQGHLTRKEGYFIYYEKNPQMQDYMVSRREQKYGNIYHPESVDDRAARNYRLMIQEKKKKRDFSKLLAVASYSVVIIALCGTSLMLVRSMQKVNHMEQAVTMLSSTLEATEQPSVTVETINGNVKPIGEIQNTETENSIDKTENKDEASETQNESTQIQDTENEGVKEETVKEENEGQDSEDVQSSATVEDAAMTEAQQYLAQGFYIVQPGDSLQQICIKIYQTDAVMDKLCEINKIENKDTIYVGQQLILP